MSTVNDLRAEALFCSDLQASEEPSGTAVRAAIDATVDRLGAAHCAELVAQEFGDHPEPAVWRMCWCRAAVKSAFTTAGASR